MSRRLKGWPQATSTTHTLSYVPEKVLQDPGQSRISETIWGQTYIIQCSIWRGEGKHAGTHCCWVHATEEMVVLVYAMSVCTWNLTLNLRNPGTATSTATPSTCAIRLAKEFGIARHRIFRTRLDKRRRHDTQRRWKISSEIFCHHWLLKTSISESLSPWSKEHTNWLYV